jgi:ATP synthase protein I
MSSFLSFGADLAEGQPEAHAPTGEQVLAETPQVERELATDMLKKGVWLAPAVVVLCTAIWGIDGFTSALFGLGLLLVNLVLSVLSYSWAAKRSQTHLLGVALFGFIARMALLVVAVMLVEDQPWIDLGALGTTILVTYVGLLVWEARVVSASLAFPGLKPGKQTTTEDLS